MIKAPSLQHEYTLIYSGDPALTLPADETARAKALEIARDTGQWSELILEGQAPTLFHVKTVCGTAWDYLIGEVVRKELTEVETVALAFRIGIMKIDNFGAHFVKRVTDKQHGQTLATTATLDAIYEETGEHGRKIIEEIGSAILARGKQIAEGNPIPPKS